MTLPLPKFRYHPDPLGTGSIEASAEACCLCKQARGFVYVGTVYGERELDGHLCPWCIADGRAHAELGAEFTDLAGVGGYAEGWPKPPAQIAEEVAWRTPGFIGWQQERWWTCCDDGGAYLGRAGANELDSRWPGARATIERESGLEGEELADYMTALSADGSPTGYVFRCLHCGKYGGYSDAH